MTGGYLLGNQWFCTKEDMKRHMQAMLQAYPLGGRTSLEDTEVLRALLEYHPRAAQKIGCGIATFEVRAAPAAPGLPAGRCFYLLRVDGSTDDFSYLKCLAAPSPRALFRAICRRLIAPMMASYKDAYFQAHAGPDDCIECPITHQRVSYEQAHVDHIPPATFEELVRGFVSLHDLDESTIPLREIGGRMGQTFADDDLAQNWTLYHQVHAQVRVVSAYANLRIIPQHKRSTEKTRQEEELTTRWLYRTLCTIAREGDVPGGHVLYRLPTDPLARGQSKCERQAVAEIERCAGPWWAETLRKLWYGYCGSGKRRQNFEAGIAYATMFDEKLRALLRSHPGDTERFPTVFQPRPQEETAAYWRQIAALDEKSEEG